MAILDSQAWGNTYEHPRNPHNMRPGGISPNPEFSESEILRSREWLTEYNNLHARHNKQSNYLFRAKSVVGPIGLMCVVGGLYLNHRHITTHESQTPTIIAAEATADTLRWTRNSSVDYHRSLPPSLNAALTEANNERKRTVNRLEAKVETLKKSPEYEAEKKFLADTDPSTTFVVGGVGLLALFGLAETFGATYLLERRLKREEELMKKYS